MIKLYSFGPAFNLVDPSPFVTKVDLHLRINKLEFESIAGANNLQKAPKGKLPFIEDQGQLIGDSAFIIEHLKQNHNADLDAWLNDQQRASAYLISKSLDENLYWCLLHSRWIKDDTWPIVRSKFFDPMPFPLNKIIALVARRSTIKNANGHGIGRHSDEQILHIAKLSLDSLSSLLGEQDYFIGNRICSLDVTAFAMLSGMTLTPIDNELNRQAKGYENLVAFTKRIQTLYYPEFV